MRVYIMSAGDLHKVGMSGNPALRRRGVYSPNGDYVVLRDSWEVKKESGYNAETFAHRLLDKYWCEGEWFDCPYEVAEEAVKQAVKHVNAGKRIPRGSKGLRRQRVQRPPTYKTTLLDVAHITQVAERYAHVR